MVTETLKNSGALESYVGTSTDDGVAKPRVMYRTETMLVKGSDRFRGRINLITSITPHDSPARRILPS